tara:strand:+ start:2033 stop:2332 length:300 start_codon:yes stop_codon:yes gene_type:complete
MIQKLNRSDVRKIIFEIAAEWSQEADEAIEKSEKMIDAQSQGSLYRARQDNPDLMRVLEGMKRTGMSKSSIQETVSLCLSEIFINDDEIGEYYGVYDPI